MKPDLNDMDKFLARYWPTPSKEEVESDGNRVLHELRSKSDVPLRERVVVGQIPQMSFSWRYLAALPAVAAVVVAVFLGIKFVPKETPAFAVVESVGGGLQGSGGAIQAGRALKKGDRFRSIDGPPAVFVLADGSRIEMRSNSELALQAASDGMVLDLKRGSIIVTAAKQHDGHLYVKTRDVTVSVVGTVFVVNAEETGSRVAVIQGEVQVQQGTVAKKLLPGEQSASNPLMVEHPVSAEIAWSPHAEAHLALLQQSSAEAPEAFEVDSVKPSAPPVTAGGRGVPGGRAGTVSSCSPVVPLRVELDPHRFAAFGASLRALVMAAYGKDCSLLSGGPDWFGSDRYDIEGIIPEGSTSYTLQQFRNGEAPKLQRMLQTLLTNRFKLSVRREMKDTSVYNLVVIKAGKLKAADGPPKPGAAVRLIPTIDVRATTPNFAELLTALVGRPVFDKTELKGQFDIHLEWAFDSSAPGEEGPRPMDQSSIQNALQEQLGLKLEAAKSPVEFLSIEHAERPTEN